MDYFNIIDVEIFGNFVKKIGGNYCSYYKEYGQNIIDSDMSREEFHQRLCDNTIWEQWKTFLTNELHIRMIKINIDYLRSDDALCRSIVYPSTDDTIVTSENDTTANTLPFPQEGISLSAISRFVDICGGEDILRNMTTTEVNNEALMPLTYAYKSSYCDLLIMEKDRKMYDDTSHEQDVVDIGKPCAFISHAWKYQFLDVLDAIFSHFERPTDDKIEELDSNDDHIIWLDLFTNNQHLAPDLDFHWWSTTFKTAIQNIGRTVMVLSPWQNPIPLTRAWCLFEIFCTVDTTTKFEVALCDEQKNGLIEAASRDILELRKMIGVIDVEKSEAWSPLDLERIFDVVKKTVGFSTINATVLMEIRKWLIDTVDIESQRVSSDLLRLQLQNTLGLLHNECGNYEKALQVLKCCVDKLNELEGLESHSSIQRKNNIAIILDSLGQTEEAATIFQQCVDMYEKTITTSKVDYYNSLNSLAVCRLRLGKYEECIHIFQQCFEFFCAKLGNYHHSTMNALGNLGICQDCTGNTAASLESFELCVQYHKEHYGDNHMDTLRWSNSLASVYFNAGETCKCLDLLEKTYEGKRVRFGSDHNSTVLTMNNYCHYLIQSMAWERVSVLEKMLQYYQNTSMNRICWRLIHTLSLVYLNIEKYELCYQHCSLLIQLAEKELSPDDPSLGSYRDHLENCMKIEKMEAHIKTLPGTVENIEIHEHVLVKTKWPYENGIFICDICNTESRGWVYHCQSCGFDVHLDCIPQ